MRLDYSCGLLELEENFVCEREGRISLFVVSFFFLKNYVVLYILLIYIFEKTKYIYTHIDTHMLPPRTKYVPDGSPMHAQHMFAHKMC